jgi:elongation factor 1-gamma
MPNTAAWIEGLTKLPEVIARIGNVKFAAKVIKPILAEKKKEEVKVAPKKAAADDEDDDGAQKVFGAKNPLDSLPATKFILPEWKTYFVNLGELKPTDGMTHFFQNYDPAGYTIYYTKYEKYEGEGVVLYQTSNLMNGFIQRCDDKFRNYAFSMMAILGEEPNLDIEAVWMFRGKGVPQEMIDHPQFEYYTKRELDVTKEADRKVIAEFFCAKAGAKINGQVVQECKMFK